MPAIAVGAAIIAAVSRTDNPLKVTAETLNESIAEMTSLEKEESEISRELTSLKRRISEMRRLKESVDQYGEALLVQRDRSIVQACRVRRVTSQPAALRRYRLH